MKLRSEARVATPTPERHLLRLCKHFEHRRAVTRTTTHGHIEFDGGAADLTAEEGVLVMTVTADSEEQLTRLEGVAGGHLERMAHGETLTIEWQRSS